MSARFALLCALTFAASAAHAVPVNVTATGNVSFVGGHLGGNGASGVAVGDPFTLNFGFESSTPPAQVTSSSSGGILSARFDALTSLSFAVGAASGSTTGATDIFLGRDRFLVQASAANGLVGPSLSGGFGEHALERVLFSLVALSEVYPDPGALPTTLTLDDFALRTVSLWYGPGSIDVRIESLSAAAVSVPEPGTLALLGCGLLALTWGARRRRGHHITQPAGWS
jgi:hypothetical protein